MNPRESPQPVPRELAQRLLHATATRTLADPSGAGGLDLDTAYAVCEASRDLVTGAGRRIAGYKLGLTSEGARQTFGAHEPTFGYVPADTVVQSGDTITTVSLFSPAIEVEVAFILGSTITDPGASSHDVLSATASVAPAFEIVDSRWAGGAANLPMLVADNTNAAGAVIGEHVAPPASLAAVTSVLQMSGRTIHGSASTVLGDPAEAVAWLARRLARAGRPLNAGDIVLSGALSPPTPLGNATNARADLHGVGSVFVTVS